RLREVTEVESRPGVHLLGVEAEWGGTLEQRPDQLVGLAASSGAGEGLDEPERAGQERAFGAGQAVASGWVAVQQRAAGGQLLSDGIDRAPYAGGVDVLDAQQRQDEQRRVEVVGAVAAGVAGLDRVEASRPDLGGDGVPRGLPPQ